MKKEIKTELTKEKIIALSIDEFGSMGYSGASLNNICSAGVSKGLLYHNYENKDALYLACVGRCFDRLTDYLRDQSIGSDWHRYFDVRLRFFRKNEREARMFFEAVLQPPEHLKERIILLRSNFDALNQELYKDILLTVRLREGVTKDQALTYFAMMQNMFNGYFSSPALCSLSLSDAIDIHEKELSKLLDFMLYGIAERED